MSNINLARKYWDKAFHYYFDGESAIKECRQLVAKDPRWCEGHNALGAVLAKQGRCDEALRCYRESLRLKPQQPGARIHLAQLLLNRNDYKEAILVLRGVDSPFSVLIDAYYLLARTIEEVGYGRAD